MTRAGVGVLALQLLAGWPSWCWWVARVTDGSDEPWGVVALLALLGLSVPRAHHPLPAAHLWALVAVNGLLALAGPSLPPLVRASVAVLAVASLLARLGSGRALHLPTWLLALLALPVLSSVQFYLGYPLRLTAAALAAPLLQLLGVPAVRAGLELQLGAQLIQVDAPCSGARMLWVGLFLAVVSAHALRLGGARTLLTCVLAVVAVVVGNAARVSTLTLLELRHFPGPEWLHAGVGVGAFVPVALLVAGAALWQQGCQHAPAARPLVQEGLT